MLNRNKFVCCRDCHLYANSSRVRKLLKMSGEIDRSQHVLPLEQPVVCLEAQSAFDGLSNKEKLYAHYLGQAAWVGGLITYIQTSPESGPVFVLMHKLFLIEKPEDLKGKALENGFSEEEVTALFVYVSGLFSNAGNYKVGLNRHVSFQ